MISDQNQRSAETPGAAVRVHIRNGLDLPMSGAPEPMIDRGSVVRHVAICATDYLGLRPRVCVEKGARVRAGDALLVDKDDPAITVTAPGSGTIVEVRRGERRVLEHIVIRLGENDSPTVSLDAGSVKPHGATDRRAVVERLCKTGLWTAIRTRPFSHVPSSNSIPAAIFVTAMDTQPLAADPQVIIGGSLRPFEHGLRALAKLTDGPLWLCTAPGWNLGIPLLRGLRHAELAGPHPAGLPGTHIHWLNNVRDEGVAWFLGYQDVIAMGRLFSENILDFRRVVALGGESATRPRLVKTRLGASLVELTRGEARDNKPYRILSGSPLAVRPVPHGPSFLGRFDVQVSLLQAASEPRAFAWWWRDKGMRPARSRHGNRTGMLPLERFERLMQPGFVAVPLLRALMAGDIDGARKLGCLELDEDDLALCAWACPAGADYPAALRRILSQIEREG